MLSGYIIGWTKRPKYPFGYFLVILLFGLCLGSACSVKTDAKIPMLLPCTELVSGDVHIATNFPSLIWPVKKKFEQAALLAINQINNGGGIGPSEYKLGFLACDTSGDIEIGISNVEAIANSEDYNVAAIVGAARDSVFMGKHKRDEGTCIVGAENKIVSITPSATHRFIGDIEDDDYCYRTCSKTSVQAGAQALLAKKIGCSRVLYLSDANDAYSEGLMGDFLWAMSDVNAADTSGLETAAQGKPIERDCSFTVELVEDLKEHDYDCLASSLLGKDMAPVINAISADASIRERSPGLRIIVSDRAYSDGFLNRLEEEAREFISDGVLLATRPGCTEDTEEFIVQYKLAYQEEAQGFEHSVYDAVMLVTLGLSMLENAAPVELEGQRANRVLLRDLLRDGRLQKEAADEMDKGAKDVVYFNESWVLVQRDIRDLIEVEGYDQVSINYVGAAGTHNFDSDGDVTSNIWIGEVKGGRFVGSSEHGKCVNSEGISIFP